MRATITFIFSFFCFFSFSQTPQEEISQNICRSGSNYYAYPAPQKLLSPSPEGKKPFYLSHYGRHGSRYLIDKNEYYNTLDIFRKAAEKGCLTEKGLEVMEKIAMMCSESDNRYGELTELGAMQHHQIAHRMYERFPEIFSDSVWIDAKSTVVIRCILSMENELLELNTLNPKLKFKHDASNHDMYYMNFNDRQLVEKRSNEETRAFIGKWEKENLHPENTLKLLFTNLAYISEIADLKNLYTELFQLANIIQNSELRYKISLYDIFSEQDIYSLWQRQNIGCFCDYGSNSLNGGKQPFTQRNLLRKIIEEADSCIALPRPGATLRFGHETMVLPLTCLLNLNGYGETMHPSVLTGKDNQWANYRIFPMGCNIQFVFYRENPEDSDVWVKVLLNEEEASLPIDPVQGCYYRWTDVRAYYVGLLDSYDNDLN